MTTKTFYADLARFDKAFRDADALRAEADGYTWIDQSKVSSDLATAYQRLMQFGYANGLV